jgi:phosphoheptose isomerase
MLELSEVLIGCLRGGGKLLACGNGGSAAQAQHLVGELVCRLKDGDRPALAALALTADPVIVTAWSNDVGYEEVFARQVQALGAPGDALLAISTSGQSPNLLRAFEAARRKNMHCLALVGCDGGRLASAADVAVVVPSSDIQRIQETQMLILHLLGEMIERQLTATTSSVEFPVMAEGVVSAGSGGPA